MFMPQNQAFTGWPRDFGTFLCMLLARNRSRKMTILLKDKISFYVFQRNVILYIFCYGAIFYIKMTFEKVWLEKGLGQISRFKFSGHFAILATKATQANLCLICQCSNRLYTCEYKVILPFILKNEQLRHKSPGEKKAFLKPYQKMPDFKA